MNASALTVHVARGIAAWAAVLDLYEGERSHQANERRAAWDEWRRDWPTMVDFVKAEQSALFDRVNAATFDL